MTRRFNQSIRLEDLTRTFVLKALIGNAKTYSSVISLSERVFLYLLDDGEWHGLSDIAEALSWPLDRVAEVARRYSGVHVVDFEEEAGRVRLQSWVMKLPRGEWVREGKASVGTFIIPPEGGMTIQGVEVRNLLDIDVEVGVRVIDDKLRELAISKLKKVPTS